MKSKSLIQVIFSLILVAFLTITSVIISPQAAVAITSSNTPLESLTTGMELQEQGDLDRAATLYQEAIDRVLANGELESLIAAKQRLASIKLNQDKVEEADRLLVEADNAIKLLGIEPGKKCGPCGSYQCAEKKIIGNGAYYCNPCSCRRCNSCS